MLPDDLPTWRETEELRLQKYGHEYIVVLTPDTVALLIRNPEHPATPQ